MHSTKNVFQTIRAEVSVLGLTQAVAQLCRVLALGTFTDTTGERASNSPFLKFHLGFTSRFAF